MGLSALCLSMFSVPFYGQAWVSPKGEMSLSLSYQFTDFPGHLNEKGIKESLAGTEAQGLTLQAEYSVNDRLAASVSIPYIAARTVDISPNPHPESNDDQKYHSTWQDYQLGLRYNLTSTPLVLTPFVAWVVPSHDYANRGEAVVGRRMNEIHVGVNAGRLLDPLLENAYVDARFAYVFSEEELGISTDRTVGDLAVGYFLTPRFSARILASYQRTHGGLTGDYIHRPDSGIPDELRLHSDRLVRANFLRTGLAGSFSVTPRVDIYAAFMTVVNGSDTHYGQGISVGVTRTFSSFRRR